MSYHVFISYPRIADQRGAVSDIRAHLERELQIKTGDKKLTVFLDQSHLSGGDPWSEALEREVRDADVLVLLLSPLWIASEWCRKELRLYLDHSQALDRDRPIIPLLWEETEPGDARTDEQVELLELIRSRQIVPWVELRHQNSSYPGYFKAISELATVIKRKLPHDKRA